MNVKKININQTEPTYDIESSVDEYILSKLITDSVLSPIQLKYIYTFYNAVQYWTYVNCLKILKESGIIYVKSIKWMAFDGITKNEQGSPTEINIYGLYLDDDNFVQSVGLKKTIVLQEEWKELDENGKIWYNIPIEERLYYAPAIVRIWLDSTKYADSGMIRNGMSIIDTKTFSQPAFYFYIKDIPPLSEYDRKINDNAQAITNSNLSIFKNKKWGVLGDSISYGQYSTKSYSTILSEELGIQLYNVSVPGQTLSGLYTQIDNLPNDLDFITVMG